MPPFTHYPGYGLCMGTDGAQADVKDGGVIGVEINDVSVRRNPAIKAR